MKKLILLILLILSPYLTWADTHNCDCSDPANVTTVFAAMDEGDTLLCTAGGTWSASVSLSGKGFTFDGGGFTITRDAAYSGNNSLFLVTTDTTHATIFDNLNLSQTVGSLGLGYNKAITIHGPGEFTGQPFIIRNCVFWSSATRVIFLNVYDSIGLIHDCTFTADDSSEMVHNEGYGTNDASGWENDVTQGSADALYIEDCTFSKYDQADQYFWACCGIQNYYGARTVIRYNTFNYCSLDYHGNSGTTNRGSRWWEIYNNNFHLPEAGVSYPGGGNQAKFMAIRGGSGVIYNNAKTGGTNKGGSIIHIYEDDTTGTYPCLDEVGRGKDQASEPAYLWSQTGIGLWVQDTGTCEITLNTDYYTSAKVGYTAYTYPHPLQDEGSAAATGTLTANLTESGIVAGGDTIVITLTGAYWVATAGDDNAITTAIISGIDSNKAEANGWDAVVKAGLTHADVVRTSDTVLTITLPAFAGYDITESEIITGTVPGSATDNESAIVASPTVLIAAEQTGAVSQGATYNAAGAAAIYNAAGAAIVAP